MTEKKDIYIYILIALIVVLCFLLMLRKCGDADYLILENNQGDYTEAHILKDIYPIKGIDFAELDDAAMKEQDEHTLETINTLKKFYEKYAEEKGKQLIKVYYIDQILRFSPNRNLQFNKLTFTSVEGASVVIEPSNNIDALILISLEKNKGQKHSLRLIMPEDNYHQRWLKNVVKIKIE